MAKVNVGTNWIRDLYYDPCDPDPWILVELAFPAVIQALWEYLQWDWEDFYEGTRGRSWQKDGKVIITGSKWQPPKAVSRGVLFLFLAEAGVQRIAWMFMVAEIIADAFIRWASLVASLPACNVEVTSDWGRSQSPIDGRPYSTDWMTGPSWTVEAGTMFPYIGARITVPPGGAFYYTTFQRYQPFPFGDDLVVVTRLVCIDDGKVVDEAPPNDPNDPQNRSSALTGKLQNPSNVAKTYQFEVKLADSRIPLVWHCVGDFVSLRVFNRREEAPTIGLPYIPLPQPSRRTAKPRPWDKKVPKVT